MMHWVKRLTVAALLAVAPAQAVAQQSAADFGYTQLPTDIVGISPQPGWRTAFFSVQGTGGELGELTREPDVTRWRNLLAYMTVASWAQPDVSLIDDAIGGVRSHCRSSATFSARPSGAAESEAWGEIVCLDTPGQANALSDAPLQIYVFRTVRTAQASFRFWRAWRGRPSDVAPMLEALGVIGVGRLATSPNDAQLAAAFAPVMQALTDRWSAEIIASMEVCSLEGPPCASLNRSMADLSFYPLLAATGRADNLAALAYVTGDNSDPQASTQFYRSFFNRDPPTNNGVGIITVLTPSNHNFNAVRSLQGVAITMLAGGKANGAFIAAGGDGPFASTQEPARMRAYLVKVARITAAAPGGPAYDSMRFDLWPNE
ncbi:MAG: hypothetical protein NT015_00755 [Alphaproteobacteria bacterium]|nr:hypothetical protein [Alphaproteobacteria bacterium]